MSEEDKERRLSEFINSYAQQGLFSVCDVVWNHVATNTPWLKDQSDASFNLSNSPHLRPAYCLDRALHRLHRRAMRRCDVINTEEDVDKIIDDLKRKVLPGLKLWEFFVVDIPDQISEFQRLVSAPESVRDAVPIEHQHHPCSNALTDECIIAGDGRRGSKKVRMGCALQLIGKSKESVQEKCVAFRRAIDRFNQSHFEQWKVDQTAILKSLRAALIYERIDPAGPRLDFVDEKSPLFPKYFTTVKDVPYQRPEMPDDEDEDEIVHDLSVDGANNLACANAGWVMGASNTLDITSPAQRIYLRRQLIVWSDCVRLRYGAKPEDSPFLWDHMKKYTVQTARLFHGFRLDNCHTTPLPVARYLLQAARSVRPNLFVCAELFVEPEAAVSYCEQLGLTCLIGEAMQASDASVLASRVYEYSGGSRNAIGSFFPEVVSLAQEPFLHSTKPPVFLYGKTPRNMFLECSHDNETPAEKRTAVDALPNAALVATTNCTIGSVLGYDQLVPHRIDVVTEKRIYSDESVGGGIELCKERLNELHQGLWSKGYTEFHIHQEGPLIMMVRHNPENHKSVYTLVHTAFSAHPAPLNSFPRFAISGEFVEELFVGLVRADKSHWERDETFINGLVPTLYWPHSNPTTKPTTAMYNIVDGDLVLTKFPPGSILSLSTRLPTSVALAKQKLQDPMNMEDLETILSQLSLVDLNKILFRCSVEDEAGTYNIPGWGNMTYSGLAGAILCFNTVPESSTVSHPICDNIRAGPWLIDFMSDRLGSYPILQRWMRKMQAFLKDFYSFLQPKYIHWYLTHLYHRSLQRVFSQMSPFIQEGCSFTKALALCSVQVYGAIRSAPLRYLEGKAGRLSPSMSAGLPHFSEGYMRSWGRDTFIALRGLMLVTGRFDEALDLILAFASCLRHGLIPNLLSGGENPRFNARDATWWFAQAVQDYCQFVYPENPTAAVKFLQETKTLRYFPHDAQEAPREEKFSSLAEILQEILEKHAAGIHFREWNAGQQIDAHMRDEGFNINITCDPLTGFIHGGNRWNCGTWMDKMGEYEEAGNRGVPATPRDGADVEIIGLLASTLRWLSSLEQHGFSQTPLVVGKTAERWTYGQWHELIVQSFEKHFFVPSRGDNDGEYSLDLSLISRRGIYKDTVGASDANSDYMFRPNLCVAMVVAPELFNAAHAVEVLGNVTKYLAGPLGMVTLDPSHPRYAPFYDTQSTDGFYLAKGFNYHQGPVSISLLL
jgi:glycogen debranching enzyme